MLGRTVQLLGQAVPEEEFTSHIGLHCLRTTRLPVTPRLPQTHGTAKTSVLGHGRLFLYPNSSRTRGTRRDSGYHVTRIDAACSQSRLPLAETSIERTAIRAPVDDRLSHRREK